MRAIIYTRVSQDKHGTGRSVAEQETECRREVERRGWELVDVFTDNDRSASQHAKKGRPSWASLKRRLQAGGVDVLVVWEQSRTTRDLGEYASFREFCRSANVLLCAGGSVVDFTNANEAMTSGIKAVVDEAEAERTRERVLRGVRANAEAGRPHGRSLFGYDRVYDPSTGALVTQVENPTEAVVVRRIVADVLAGHSLYSITKALNAEGAPTPTSTPWIGRTVKRVAINPAYAGLRVHQGRVFGAATWAPIIPTIDHHRAVAILTDPSRKTNKRRERVHLLAGVLECGKCGGRLNAFHESRPNAKGVRPRIYRCRNGGDVAILADTVDAFVVATVLERLGRPDGLATAVTDAVGNTDKTALEIVELRRRLDEAADQYAEGTISGEMLSRVEQRVRASLDVLERQRRASATTTAVDDLLDADNAAASWDSLTIEQRVEVLRALVRITIMPNPRRGSKVFDPARIVIEWRL